MTTLLGGTSTDVPLLPDAPVRWTALRYDPADDAATRAYLWRQMRSRSGVNVHRGLWAVPHGTDTGPDLSGVVRRLRAGGARVGVTDIERDDDLNDDLATACERLWAGFFAASDRLRERMAGPPATAPPGSVPPAHDLSGLHERFARTLATDLVHGDVVSRAARVLDDLEWIGQHVRRRVADQVTAPVGPALEVATTVSLHGGGVRVVAHLRPVPGPRWERDLAGFEDATYRADGRRPVLRHGTLVAAGAADEVVATLNRVNDRIGRFNVALI